MEDRILSVAQAAEVLGLTPARVRQYCQEGRIGFMAGGIWLIKTSELMEFAKTPRKAGRPKQDSPAAQARKAESQKAVAEAKETLSRLSQDATSHTS